MNTPSNPPITVSILLTVLLLILVTILSMLGQILALNGVMDATKGNTALGIGLGCNGVTIILAAFFVRWLANLLVKFNWNRILAVAVVVIVGAGLGTIFSFLSIIVGTMAAGIR
jgi:hypothetical protein